jgi:hypothetical protein
MLDALLADNTWLWISPLIALAVGSAVMARHIGEHRPQVEDALAVIVSAAFDNLMSGVTAEVTAQEVTAQLTALTARVWSGDRLTAGGVNALGERVHPVEVTAHVNAPGDRLT